MIDAADIQVPVIARGRVAAVRFLGIVFAFLGVVAGIAGNFWIFGSFQEVFEGRAGPDDLHQTFARLFAPVAISVIGTWFLVWVGVGLWRKSSPARWAAVGTLLLACVPPLVRVFGAVRVGYPQGAALALLMLLVPALTVLLLADARTDPLFRRKAIATLEAAPARPAATWVTFALVIVSYVVSVVLGRASVGEVAAARVHMARFDWPAAIRCIDRARWMDPFSIDAALLRATCFRYDDSSPMPDRSYWNADALADADWYLRYHPDSGEAHFQRGMALAGLGQRDAARDAFTRAIAMMADPTGPLVERAWVSLDAKDFAAADRDIAAAIARHPEEPRYPLARSYFRDVVGNAVMLESPRLSAAEREERIDRRLRGEPDRRPE